MSQGKLVQEQSQRQISITCQEKQKGEQNSTSNLVIKSKSENQQKKSKENPNPKTKTNQKQQVSKAGVPRSSSQNAQDGSKKNSQAGPYDSGKGEEKKNNRVYYGAGGAVAFICTFIAINFIRFNPEIIFQNVKYSLHVHCPVPYLIQRYSQKSKVPQQLLQFARQHQKQLNKTYFVLAYTGIQLGYYKNKTKQQILKVHYCGAARLPHQTCNQSMIVCSTPGPSFDVEKDEEITVYWMNGYRDVAEGYQHLLDNFAKANNNNTCYKTKGPSQRDKVICEKKGKTRDLQSVCTLEHLHKTKSINCKNRKHDILEDTLDVITNRSSFPLSPHVHGLQVQPYYDGHPTSWFDNNGKVGIGFYTPDSSIKRYMNDKKFRNILKQFNISQYQVKINIYKNVQQPGTLWYHDHAMGTTYDNVALGLHSYYIIRDKQAERYIPKGQYQHIILLLQGFNNKSTYLRNCSDQCFSQSEIQCQRCLFNSTPTLKIDPKSLKFNTTYRFRILNGNFRQNYKKIQFLSPKACTNPQQSKKNKSCFQVLKFTVIGTDSALRRNPVFNVEQVSLAPAERVDILLTTPSLAKNINQEFKIIVNSATVQVMDKCNVTFQKLAEFIVQNQSAPAPVNITSLNVPFCDLSKVPDSLIAVKRMRALFFTLGDFWFGINFHTRFHQGLPQNPKIGTIQDWYMINTMAEGHPIHIHLIQFQVQKLHSLRYIHKNSSCNGSIQIEYCSSIRFSCSYYNVDIIANKIEQMKDDPKIKPLYNEILTFPGKFSNYLNICNITLAKIQQPVFQVLFKNWNNEDKIDENRVSGVDIFSTCQSVEQCQKFGYINKTKQPKYIVPENQKDEDMKKRQFLPQYQKGWKDTFYIPAMTVAQYRIRWTRTDFPQDLLTNLLTNPTNSQHITKACKQGFFNIDQRQLTKCPGYVYHCHILDHEDKQMMRPIMLEPSVCREREVSPWVKRWEEEYCEYKEKGQQRGVEERESVKEVDEGLRLR